MANEEGLQLHVTFVCTFNILRSPMAEKMFTDQIGRRRLGSRVRVTSGSTDAQLYAGTRSNARHVLQRHGDPTPHRAGQIGTSHLSADLLVTMTGSHARVLASRGVPAERIRLLRSSAPESGARAPDVQGPYYSARPDLERTYNEIEASLPGLQDWVDEHWPLAAWRADLALGLFADAVM
jgi:protein-tyrosine phosphatase